MIPNNIFRPVRLHRNFSISVDPEQSILPSMFVQKLVLRKIKYLKVLSFNQTSYLPQDRRLFEFSLVRLYHYPTPMKQQWPLSVHQAQLRKIAANVTPIFQEL